MKKLKILTFNWHEGYIHLLAKTGYQFDVVEKWKGGRYGWIKEFRPVPTNCRLISEDEAKAGLKSGKYDRTIAHNINDLLFVYEFPIPKVLIFHNKLSCEIALGGNTVNREEYLNQVRQLFNATKNLALVFISKEKRDDWGIDGEIILPGIDIFEYGGYTGDIPKVLRIGNGLRLRDIMLGYSIQEKILNGLPSTILGLNPDVLDSYIPGSWDELKEFMGTHRVYLNTTLEPYEDGYNLAMLEAMATAMPVVSVTNSTSPIENGFNGYVSNDIGYLRDRIEELVKDLPLAKLLGQRARETVTDKFPIEKFIQNWKRVLGDPSPIPLPQGERVRGRVEDVFSRQKKLRILMSYTSNPATTAAYMEKALRKSHDVITYGPKIDEAILKAWDLEEIRDRVRDHDIPYFTSDIGKVLQRLPGEWVPDLFLWVESGIWYPLEGLKGLPCPTVCYLIDTHLHLEKHLEMAKAFDYVFLAQKEYIPRFKESGVKNVFWLPLACDPEIHTPLYPPLPRGELRGGVFTNIKLYDIGFVGSLIDPRRVDLLNKLKQRFNVYYERCFLERMAEVFSQSRIVFNSSVKDDLNMRVFEAMASGSMLLTDEAKGSGLTELFHDKKHLVIYRDEKELLEFADYYLRHDEERERVAEEGMKEVLSKHTYECRIMEMTDILSSFLDEKKKRKDERVFDTHPEAVILQPYCVGRGIDVGCGFRKTHPDAIGVDLLGKGEVGEHGCMQGMQSVADIKASGDNLYMFKDGELDYVVSRHNLEHYVDPVKTIQEWKRVLKPGGVLGMVLPDESRINTIALDPTHKHCFTPQSIKNLLELIGGFQIERLEPVIENWSFVVIAGKIDNNKIIQPPMMHSFALPKNNNSTSKGGDYFRQERKDIEALIPEDAMRILDVGCGEEEGSGSGL